MKKTKGSIHIFTAIMLFFAIIGAWYVYKSYQEHKLTQNLQTVFNDYRSWAMSVTSDVRDKAELQQAFDKIQQITSKYSPKQLPAMPKPGSNPFITDK